MYLLGADGMGDDRIVLFANPIFGYREDYIKNIFASV